MMIKLVPWVQAWIYCQNVHAYTYCLCSTLIHCLSLLTISILSSSIYLTCVFLSPLCLSLSIYLTSVFLSTLNLVSALIFSLKFLYLIISLTYLSLSQVFRVLTNSWEVKNRKSGPGQSSFSGILRLVSIHFRILFPSNQLIFYKCSSECFCQRLS